MLNVQSRFYFVILELEFFCVSFIISLVKVLLLLCLLVTRVSLFFFQNYTQYIPLSIYDLQTWMGSPSIFVYDCSNAGLIVKSFKQFALQREQELEVRSQAVAKLSLGFGPQG